VTEPSGAPTPRSWPPNADFADADAVAAVCGACTAPWRVHRSLAGFRLRCGCGAWVDVPRAPGDREPSAAELRWLPDPGSGAEPPPAPVHDGALEPAALRTASARHRAHWTNRTLLELGAMLAALLVPQVLAFALSDDAALLPFASLCSALLVALVVLGSGRRGPLGFRAAAPRFWLEAIVVTAAAVPLALGWVAVLEHWLPDLELDGLDELTHRLGVPMTLVVVALSPAMLEEVIFRGLLQNRLLVLLGVRAGLVATAALFAACHVARALARLAAAAQREPAAGHAAAPALQRHARRRRRRVIAPGAHRRNGNGGATEVRLARTAGGAHSARSWS
jgi:membrane protease YdiL (CAAX protease family)